MAETPADGSGSGGSTTAGSAFSTLRVKDSICVAKVTAVLARSGHESRETDFTVVPCCYRAKGPTPATPLGCGAYPRELAPWQANASLRPPSPGKELVEHRIERSHPIGMDAAHHGGMD